ncbi:helix-turn-helix domain-containing protein [Rubellimicrobium rubrum]|uniref:Helix-turn-helix domain-containing protein n=1 Tax=Rubellimicrobium rubrum TaxID=2585369 RepID=A0A5C4MWC8_9RHOB|nr:helix-turn-helix domain-containing protein [Rubellimicrobium rubrum]TNC49303.1 helix-turn-helix domain-containing protein [Rubellimicrobium rubrum]
MNPPQAAQYSGGLSTSFLAKLRMEKNRHRGPAFVKVGRAILYRKADLDHWLASLIVEVE